MLELADVKFVELQNLELEVGVLITTTNVANQAFEQDVSNVFVACCAKVVMLDWDGLKTTPKDFSPLLIILLFILIFQSGATTHDVAPDERTTFTAVRCRQPPPLPLASQQP